MSSLHPAFRCTNPGASPGIIRGAIAITDKCRAGYALVCNGVGEAGQPGQRADSNVSVLKYACTYNDGIVMEKELSMQRRSSNNVNADAYRQMR